MDITNFDGEYAFLSNFHETPVYYDGRLYGSSEAAYQAQKAVNLGKLLMEMREEVKNPEVFLSNTKDIWLTRFTVPEKTTFRWTPPNHENIGLKSSEPLLDEILARLN